MILQANAKINLSLNIIGKRQDGYHDIDSLMQSVSLADTVTLTPARSVSVTCSTPQLSGAGNLAFRAAEEFLKTCPQDGGVSIQIQKRIPVAAGLGGGSADAAAVIIGLNALYRAGLSREQLIQIGMRVGADVGFCTVGGTARVAGIGERILPLFVKREFYYVLMKMQEKPSTKEMYAQLDAKPLVHPLIEETVTAMQKDQTDEFCRQIGNSFSAVFDWSREREMLNACGAYAVGLSGSGPTVFGMFASMDAAEKAARQLQSQQIRAWAVHSVQEGCSVV